MLLKSLQQIGIIFFLINVTISELTKSTNCFPTEYKCQDGTCLPGKVECDGFFDCSRGEDESNCNLFSEIGDDCVAPAWFQCHSKNRCIASLFLCDSETDCPDGSDELNCPEKVTENQNDCLDDEFRCVTSGACINKAWLCDGTPDCKDGSDETVGCPSSFLCNDGFRCKNNHCILKEFHCDGDNDCGDNSDEDKCDTFHDPAECFAADGLYLCHDRVLCLELKHVCDKTPHCFDESDELGCDNKNMPTCVSANCSHSCGITPNGPRCHCPDGYRLDKNMKTCVDVDECSIFGFCSQRCNNTVGSFKCSCDEGYQLQADKKTCKVKGGEALLLFASGTQIRGYYLDSQVYFSVANDLEQVTAVSHNGHHVFWTNINEGEEMIVRSNEDGSDRQIVIDTGLGLPEDLEVDYVTGNIYFTDSDKKHIGVCSSDGLHCTVLVNEDVDKPRAIALLSRKGILYWSDWGKYPMIAVSGMDGSNPKPLVEKDIHWPNGLALDFSNDRIYWVDAKLRTISTVRLDGSDRKEVLKYTEAHPFAISVFEDFLYWSDWMGSEVQRCHKFTGKNLTALFKERDHKNIFGVHIYHSLLHPRVVNPCEKSDCDGICLLAPNNSYTCACSEDAKLEIDRKTCHREPKKPEIVLVNGNHIHMVTRAVLGKQQYPLQIQNTDIEKITAIAYNSLSDSVLLSDSNQRKIFEYEISSRRMSAVLTSGIGKITSMSHDPYTNNLYTCDEEKRTLDVWSLHSKTRKILIKYSSGHRAVSVVVAADQRLIFVAVSWPNEEIHINKISIDGSENSNVIIASSILGNPVHMAFDHKTETLYWYNSFFKAVESAHIAGTMRNISVILPAEATGLAIYDSTVFWTIKQTPRLYNWKIESGQKFISIDTAWGDSLLLTSLINPTNASHPCQRESNGGCSHICYASTEELTCGCADSFHLLADGKTCVDQIVCNENQFRCSKDSICISRILRCDKKEDCPNGEDEQDCAFDFCRHDQFRCRNGQCISQNKTCDFNYDCADRSDEMNCIDKCKDGFFPCGSGECISEIWACDGDNDCADGSDENVCGEMTCEPGKFMCKSGTCISKHWECDGDMDCMDGSDEHNQCRPKQCDYNEWKCKNKQCIEKELRCNGYNDCGDNSDEIDCRQQDVTECSHDEFLCSALNPICVPNSARCNYTSECPLGEDETDCARCHRGEFQCKNKKCVSNRWVCDGENDCGDNSDEAVGHCDSSTRIGIKQNLPCDGFRCLSGECLPLYMVCNAHNDCADGSDEGGRCNTSCTEAVCQGICVATPTEAICQCHEGFLLNSDGHTCTDIDECLEDRCTQNCVNTPGSFVCTCSADYILKNDRVTCKAKGDRLSFVIGGDDEVKKIKSDLNHVDLVLYEPGNSIIGMDVDSRKKILYWTSGTTNMLNIYKLQDGSRSSMSGVGRPGKLSLDWITGNLFFIDKSTPNQISVCHLIDRKCSVILTIEEGPVISNLVFDPIRGFLFYAKTIPSGLRKPYSKIFKYDIATQNATLLVSHEITIVSGMVVDPVRLDLYWSDLHQQVIERVSYDGANRKIIFRNDVRRPEGLALFEDSLYWLNKGSGELTKCDVYGEIRGSCTTMSLHMYDAKYLSLHHEARQPLIPNPCSNITCDSYSLCVITPIGGRCVCEDGNLATASSACSEKQSDASVMARASVADFEETKLIGYRYNGTSIFLAVFLTILSMIALLAGFVFMKKSRSMPLILESFYFRNPTFGASHVEGDMHHRLLTPGQHEFVNQSAFVKHPNGDLGFLTSEKEEARRVIQFQDCESDTLSEQYEEVVDLKANLIP